MLRIGLALVMFGWSALAWAGSARVSFVHPENFADVGIYEDERQATADLSGIARHMEELAARGLPQDQSIEVDVLDVNLAGYLKVRSQWTTPYRVMNDGTPPSMRLRYRLMQGGNVLASGEATLSDLSYLHFVNRYPTTDRLRFEKRMLDQWFSDQFGQRSAP